ncbi:hypothetical protein LQ772_13495 [Frateuria edaphi]|nr:hypothetical protein [Frateuria edaphi]UGB44995.1 hypothetical protein LQ772_13495 [Frateuria edaphi]
MLDYDRSHTHERPFADGYAFPQACGGTYVGGRPDLAIAADDGSRRYGHVMAEMTVMPHIDRTVQVHVVADNDVCRDDGASADDDSVADVRASRDYCSRVDQSRISNIARQRFPQRFPHGGIANRKNELPPGLIKPAQGKNIETCHAAFLPDVVALIEAADMRDLAKAVKKEQHFARKSSRAHYGNA